MVTHSARPARVFGFLASVLCLSGCGKGEDAAGSGPAASTSSDSKGTSNDPARGKALLGAEHRRASRDVLDADLSHRDVNVRRAAARALARIADARAADLLAKSIADEDEEVVVWSAYGLGYACKDREAKVVKALSVRAASLLLEREVPPNAAAAPLPENQQVVTRAALAPPLGAIAGALGRCATPEAERALRGWLAGDLALAEDAALGLGIIGSRAGRLDDTTLVALLDAASRPKAPAPAALGPFARLSGIGAPVRARLLEVARALLAKPGPARAFAVGALAAAGEEAAPELARVVGATEFSDVGATEFSDAERATAARALGRLGPAGQKSLESALENLLSDPALTSEKVLASSRFGVVTALLDALTPPLEKSAPLLARLTDLPNASAPAAERRVVALRCRAADLLAGRGTLSPKLTACDPDPNGRAGRFAFLRVLDRGPLRGQRLKRFTELTQSKEPAVRQRALELLARHPETKGLTAFLVEALSSKTPGDVATAAELLSKHPDRATTTPKEKPRAGDAGAPEPTLSPAAPAPDATVVRALMKALDTWSKEPDIEVRSALVDAAGALELLGAKGRLELDCKSPHPALRSHAEKALARLGQRDRRCDIFEPDYAPPGELAHLLAAPQKLVFDTDAGPLELVLDPTLAPVAATRLADLARSGFFNGVAVHRVVPGFVVQLGDPGGDGYGGAKGPPLRCETSPSPFETGVVGIALGGRDTGSSQFFVMLGRHPHLDGEYAIVGRAGAGWDRVAEGDIVQKVRVAN
jgi:cyclophilin family peptidyl-prolyl cis-trans isomerase/HEAT repeat protein